MSTASTLALSFFSLGLVFSLPPRRAVCQGESVPHAFARYIAALERSQAPTYTITPETKSPSTAGSVSVQSLKKIAPRVQPGQLRTPRSPTSQEAREDRSSMQGEPRRQPQTGIVDKRVHLSTVCGAAKPRQTLQPKRHLRGGEAAEPILYLFLRF